ncbi:hypothetical protein QTP86_007566 [Hemibagrus guttatus]|nr:hypothetical protein QTP86_007566 [Hemibagrus guttatus]
MKLWERVVEARLRKVVEVCEQQYGFMPRKSTTDAIFALRILMEKYESREQVEENLERWRFALERRGMKVSGSKTEYMFVNEREGSGTVRLQGEEVKKVQEFKYLGSTVQSNGECGKEERSLAQKQIWMMDDILSGLKPNRRRFKALIALHTPTMFPLLHNSSPHPEESVPYWGEDLEPPSRPPLPLELENKSTKQRSEWAEPNYPVDVRVMNRDSDLNVMSEQRHTKLKRADRIRERGLKSALRRSDSAHPLKFIDIEGSGNHCQKSTQSLRTERVRFHGNMWMAESDVPESPPTLSDIKPSSTNHVSTLTINNLASEETDERVNCSSLTSQRAEWFLSTNHWQEFIPLNIEEEELSPSTQNSDTSTNQDSEHSTNQTHLGGKLNTTTSLVAMETLDKNTPKPSDTLPHQPVGTSPELQSDRSGLELCIYEEIQHKAPESATEDNGSVVGGVNIQQTHLSTNHNASSSLSANQHVSLDVGGGENRTMEGEAAKETGSDITSIRVTMLTPGHHTKLLHWTPEHQNWIMEQWKKEAWSDELWFHIMWMPGVCSLYTAH